MPLYPMIDCEDTETSKNNRSLVWNTRRNHYGWRKYLAGLSGEIPCYASAARRKDYSGLPPAYTFVSTAEPFYSETVTYIENLKKAGIPAEIDIYPGLYHAFDTQRNTLESELRKMVKSIIKIAYKNESAAKDYVVKKLYAGDRKLSVTTYNELFDPRACNTVTKIV